MLLALIQFSFQIHRFKEPRKARHVHHPTDRMADDHQLNYIDYYCWPLGRSLYVPYYTLYRAPRLVPGY